MPSPPSLLRGLPIRFSTYSCKAGVKSMLLPVMVMATLASASVDIWSCIPILGSMELWEVKALAIKGDRSSKDVMRSMVIDVDVSVQIFGFRSLCAVTSKVSLKLGFFWSRRRSCTRTRRIVRIRFLLKFKSDGSEFASFHDRRTHEHSLVQEYTLDWSSQNAKRPNMKYERPTSFETFVTDTSSNDELIVCCKCYWYQYRISLFGYLSLPLRSFCRWWSRWIRGQLHWTKTSRKSKHIALALQNRKSSWIHAPRETLVIQSRKDGNRQPTSWWPKVKELLDESKTQEQSKFHQKIPHSRELPTKAQVGQEENQSME